ncbi:hypothetical protein DM01DRAFT_1318605 [Hesseltinella vesiculosa]|uniref:Mediator of RNA polymerase II transcription subunit 12 n=1 Tax=Hesseltinella vesiculosa TaxID=101127 RepID=A0A1X2GQJ7_9FUNG|nr:hypothetical protein DM01DRAFT_1318605 [Hesseltinella vesiculosa]
MSGRHQGTFTRYSNTGGSSYGNSNPSNATNLGHNLNIPFPPQNNGTGPGFAGSSNSFTGTPTNTTSPYSTTSSPGYHSPNVSKQMYTNPPLKKYSLQPPPKLPPFSKSMTQLGYPGIFPQRPNQDEDILTEPVVRKGFMDKPAVPNEQTCAHDIIYSKLQEDNRLLKEMGGFMVDVLKRKRKAARISGSTSFKPPARNALLDQKKEQWIQELANGVAPLRKLAKGVPHGYKGDKLLEMLAAKQIPFLRATWYIKIVGLSEMSQRNVNSVGATASHALSWTIVVTSYLKKQLSDLLPLPTNNVSTPNSMRSYRNSGNIGMNDTQMKPWSSPEAKARFEARWSYSTKLTRWQYSEGLLDQRNFLKWSLDTLYGCTCLEILWLVLTGLVQDYIDEYRRNRTLTKYLIETLIRAYSAVLQCSHQADSSTGTLAMLSGLKRDIERILQSLFLSSPDMFVIPKLYHQYRHIFDTILGDQARARAAKTLPDVCLIMDTTWHLVKERNEVFCGTVEDNQQRSSQQSNTLTNTTSLAANPNSEVKSASTPVTDIHETRSSAKGSTISSDQREPVEEVHIVHVLDTVGRSVDSGYLLLNATNGCGWCDAKGRSSVSCCALIMAGCTNGSTGTIQTQVLRRVVHTLCQWAISDARSGDWRPFLVASILLCWRDHDSKSQRRDALQEALVSFLDEQITIPATSSDTNECTSATSTSPSASTLPCLASPNADWNEWPTNTSTSFLYDTLIRLQLFSYHHYLNRLTARGILEHSQRDQPHVRRCLYHLKSLPLMHPAPSYLVNQRRVALYGPRRTGAANDEQDMLGQLQSLAKQWIIGPASTNTPSDPACLFGMDARDRIEPVENTSAQAFDLALCDKLESRMQLQMNRATRYTLTQFTNGWLVPETKCFVVKNIQIGEDNWRVMTSPGACLLNARQYLAITQILALAQDYLSLIDVALWVLEKTNDGAVYGLVLDTLRRYGSIWKLTQAGSRVAKTVWTKYKELQLRGVRDRDLMLYLVQLVQEGHVLADDMRMQLQQDLQMKTKIRARAATSLVDELQQVIQDNMTVLAVQTATEAIAAAFQYQPDTFWISQVLQTMMQVADQWIKQTASTGQQLYDHPDNDAHHYHQHASSFYLSDDSQITLKRILSAYADLIKGLANQYTLTGQIDDVILAWLLTKPVAMDEMRHPQSWLCPFIALLVSRRLVSLETIFYRFVLPWFDEIQQDASNAMDTTTGSVTVTTSSTNSSSSSDPHHHHHHHHHHHNVNESTDAGNNGGKELPNDLMNVCENLMILIRLLLVQEHCYWQQQDDGSGMYQQPWPIRAEERFRLTTLRQTQMACSLDKIEPMFALMKKLVLIASNLPLSSPLLQELVMLRADLLQIGWFRQACIRDLNGVYQRFASHGNEALTEKNIKRKMLSIVDELISGGPAMRPSGSSGAATVQGAANSHGLDALSPMLVSTIHGTGTTATKGDPENGDPCIKPNHLATNNDDANAKQSGTSGKAAGATGMLSTASSVLLQEPDFIDKIRRVFLNVSQWNEEQCRVQVSLLLDNILLSDASHNPNNPHLLGGDDGLSTTSTGGVPNNKPTHAMDQAMDDATSGQVHRAAHSILTPTNNKDLDAFVRFFFSVILSSQDQRRSLFYKNVIRGLREPILLALLRYGVQLLEGADGPSHLTATSHAMDMLVGHHLHHHHPPLHQAKVASLESPSTFPRNVLLLASSDEPFDATRYAFKSQAFLNFMQHMLAQNVWDDTKKIELLKTLHQQIKRYVDHLQVYQVMQETHSSYTKALTALDMVKNNVDAAITLLTTEGLNLESLDIGITLQDLRTSLLIRLRLMIPFVSLIWEFPKEDECDALSWTRVLMLLLGNPIVHGNGSQERFFEFVLDLVSLIIDEVPKELRKPTLALLANLHNDLTQVPLMFQSRVHRILPFSTHNIYLTPSRLSSQLVLGSHSTSSDPLQQQQHLETCMEQSKPWEWIEDYVGELPHDNDAPISLAYFHAKKSRKTDGTYVKSRN